MAYHAELQHRVAQMGLALDSIGPHLDRVADDWASGVDHGAAWPAKIFAAKFHAVEESWRVVDLALDVAGGFGIFRKSGLEQLFRDARLGRIHPANSMLTHEIVPRPCSGSALTKRLDGVSSPWCKWRVAPRRVSAALAGRDNREYRTYLRAEQRRQRGCIARRMQRHLHHGLQSPVALHGYYPAGIPAGQPATLERRSTSSAPCSRRASSTSSRSSEAVIWRPSGSSPSGSFPPSAPTPSRWDNSRPGALSAARIGGAVARTHPQATPRPPERGLVGAPSATHRPHHGPAVAIPPKILRSWGD